VPNQVLSINVRPDLIQQGEQRLEYEAEQRQRQAQAQRNAEGVFWLNQQQEKVSLPFQKRANKACSGWWGFCGFEKHFSGFGFFLLSNIFSARPTTTNANR
jgi:hypothetical protein